jgi:hypothetical protein
MTEHEIAIREAEQIAASDAYFGARTQIDTDDRRRVFEAGFRAAWQTQMVEVALPKRPEPLAPANTVGLEWDAYSGMQMLSFGRECVEAQRLVLSNALGQACEAAIYEERKK